MQVLNNTKDQDTNPGGLFIPAGLMLGMGAGFLMGNLPAGLFIGLGVGFLLFGLTSLIKRK